MERMEVLPLPDGPSRAAIGALSVKAASSTKPEG